VIINPGEFVLASTMERFCIPNDVLIVAHDKSSLARRGLAVQNTIFDPGWRGYATLELTNHSKETLNILAGDPVAQVTCHLLTGATTEPYAGKYQDQQAGPQPARDDAPEEIGAAKVAALADVLKVKLPELVAIAFTRFKAELRRIVPGLSDAEWDELKREEDQRRAACGMARMARLLTGDKVQKVGGDYTFVGVVVSVFWKRSGHVRYVVEDDRGILHIFSEKNLAPQESSHAHSS